MHPVAVVGDVHGCSSALMAASSWFSESWDGHVVFVGDYVNRGPDARAVLEQLSILQNELGDRLTLLRGNHDAVLLEFLESGDRSRFLSYGGLQTMRSYLHDTLEDDPFSQFRRTFPARDLTLLRGLSNYFETEEVLITHAGFNPSRPGSRSPEDVVFGSYSQLFSGELRTPRPLVVCGHYVQRGLRPYSSDNLICLDTGCGSVPGAPLSVVLLPSREFKFFGG